MIRKYGISGLPTLMVFNNGNSAVRQTGGMPQSSIESWVRASIGQ